MVRRMCGKIQGQHFAAVDSGRAPRLAFTPDVRTASAVISLVLAFLAAACATSDSVDEQDRADARAYVEAAQQFSRLTPPLIRAAEEATARTFFECTLVRLGEPDLPPVSKLSGLSVIAYYQALLPAYRLYARRLVSIQARDSVLSDVAEAALVLVRRYGVLRTARPDYCRTFRAWKAIGWREDFRVMTAIGVSETTFDVDGSPRDSELSEAEQTIAASGEQLRRLGIGEAGVDTFLLVTDAFAAGRGGYTEIARLARD